MSALLLAAGDALSSRFGACTVRGEVTGFSRAGSGHCYFSLKDADGAAASLRCAMFRRAASMLGFAVRDGERVEVRGRVAVYEARGELQFIVESMQRVARSQQERRHAPNEARRGLEGGIAQDRPCCRKPENSTIPGAGPKRRGRAVTALSSWCKWLICKGNLLLKMRATKRRVKVFEAWRRS